MWENLKNSNDSVFVEQIRLGTPISMNGPTDGNHAFTLQLKNYPGGGSWIIATSSVRGDWS